MFTAKDTQPKKKETAGGPVPSPVFAPPSLSSRKARSVYGRPAAASGSASRLRVGGVNDPLEQEADRVADEVVGNAFPQRLRSPAAPQVQAKADRSSSSSSSSSLSSSSSSSSSGDAPGIVHDVLRGPGQPLSKETRGFMEPRLGRSLGDVRVHLDPRANRSAEAVGARAYTVGRRIVFGPGQYSPETPAGRRLLAHELAHTMQQSASPLLRRAPADSAPVAANPGAKHEEHTIAEFDVNNNRKRAWNLNVLAKAIVAELDADPRAEVRIYGVNPTDSKEDDPGQAAADRAESVKKALMQWIGPAKAPESRFYFGITSGVVSDPQVQVAIGYTPEVISSGKSSSNSSSGAGEHVAGLGMRPDSPLYTPPGQRDYGTPGGGGESDTQSSIGGQWTIHLNKPGKVERTVQIALQKGILYYQFAVNLDTKDVQALVGVQLQKDSQEKMATVLGQSFKLKASAFLQILGGITRSEGQLSGAVTFQVQAGGQIQVTFQSITVALQLAPSITYQAGQNIALDFNVAPAGGAESLKQGNFPPFLGIPILVGTF